MKQLMKRFAVLMTAFVVAASLAPIGGTAFAADGDASSALTTAQVQTQDQGQAQAQAQAQRTSGNSVVPVFSGLPSETSMTEDLTSFSYYSDSLFADDAATYNDDLAYASANLAAAADNSNTGGTDYAAKACNIKRYLTDIGCADVTVNGGYADKPAEKSNIGVAIGHKAIRVNGQDYRLFVFGVRGGGYEREWAPNLKVGESGDHQGFQEARDAALAFILPYIKEHAKSGERIKIWASGYCRGGVVANMACAWLDKWIYERNNNGRPYKPYDDSYKSDHSVLGLGADGQGASSYDKASMAFTQQVYFSPTDDAFIDKSIKFSEHDVYCYPVNNPQASSKTDVAAHAGLVVGIHNLINPDDWFPQVAMGWSDWDFARYGTDHDITRTYGDSSFANRDKSILETNAQAVKDTLARLKKINPSASYTSPEFRQYYFAKAGFTIKVDEKGEGNKFVSVGTELKYNQGKYFEEFFRFLLMAAGCEKRGQYVDKLQNEAIYLMDLTLGAPVDVRDKMGAVMKKHAFAEFKRVTDVNIDSLWGKLKLLASFDGWMSEGSDVVDKILLGTLKNGFAELKIDYDENKLKTAVTSLAKIVRGVCREEQKLGLLNFYHLVTMSKVGAGISQTHYPEVSLSWWPEPKRKSVVSVDAGGKGEGTVSGEGLYVQGTTAKLTAQAKQGSDFAGWYQGGEKIGSESTINLDVKGDSLVEARFALAAGAERTLTLDLDGGTIEGGTTSYSVRANAFLPDLPNPTKDGNVFVGWTTEQSKSETLIDAGNYTMPDNDLKLYALWKDTTPKVTVTFSANYEGAPEVTMQQKIGLGKTAALAQNTFTREGYDFAGWNTEANGTGASYADKEELFAAQDIILYAQWRPSLHELSFRVDGGNLPEAITRRTGEALGTLPNPKVLMENGEYVQFWTLVDEAGDVLKPVVGSGDLVDAKYPGNMVLVATTGKLPSRSVRFFSNLDDKQVASSANLVLETPVYQGGRVRIASIDSYDGDLLDDEAILRYTAPTREGYSFAGWSSKPGADGMVQVYASADDIIWYGEIPEGGVDLFATWAKGESYEIDYHANGGQSSKGDTITQYETGTDSAIAIAANPFSRAGHVFTGWNTKADGTGRAVQANTTYAVTDLGLPAYDELVRLMENAGSEEEFEKALQAGTLTLYAQWTPVVSMARPALTATMKVSSKKAVLSWKAVEHATSYTVSWRQVGKKGWKSITTSKLKYTVKKLKAGKRYQFKVRAANAVSTGSWSGVAYRYMKTTTKVKVTADKKKLTVTWKRTPGATGYRIKYSTSKKFTKSKTVKVGKGKTTKRTIKGLKSKKRYYVKVIPVKKASGKTYVGGESARKTAKTK